MKTAEEAAIEYAKNVKYLSDFIHDGPSAKEGFLSGVAFAEEWISVEDELPERGIVVLAKCGKTYWIADLQPHGKGLTLYSIRGSRYSEEFEATHWRPINRK